jgi:hypothetical protein
VQNSHTLIVVLYPLSTAFTVNVTLCARGALSRASRCIMHFSLRGEWIISSLKKERQRDAAAWPFSLSLSYSAIAAISWCPGTHTINNWKQAGDWFTMLQSENTSLMDIMRLVFKLKGAVRVMIPIRAEGPHTHSFIINREVDFSMPFHRFRWLFCLSGALN